MTGIENKLKADGIFVGKTQGASMEPMIKEGRDTVVIVPPVFPLKKGDVPVYRRDDHYTMHRIVAVMKNGYLICGDNRTDLERGITDSDIIGVLTAFYQDGKYVECTDKQYLDYVRKVLWRTPFKVVAALAKNAVKKLFGRK